MTNSPEKTVPAIQIECHILLVRGEKVILDADLATLYEVETRVLVQAVKRNIERFPADFIFQLSKEEFDRLRSQFVTLNEAPAVLRSQTVTLKDGRGKHRKYLPHVFTEQSVAMLSRAAKQARGASQC